MFFISLGHSLQNRKYNQCYLPLRASQRTQTDSSYEKALCLSDRFSGNSNHHSERIRYGKGNFLSCFLCHTEDSFYKRTKFFTQSKKYDGGTVLMFFEPMNLPSLSKLLLDPFPTHTTRELLYIHQWPARNYKTKKRSLLECSPDASVSSN